MKTFYLWLCLLIFLSSLTLTETNFHAFTLFFCQTLNSLCSKDSLITYVRSLMHFLYFLCCSHKISCFESINPIWSPIASYQVALNLIQAQVWENKIIVGFWSCFFSKYFVSFGNLHWTKGLIFYGCFEIAENYLCLICFIFKNKTFTIKLLLWV